VYVCMRGVCVGYICVCICVLWECGSVVYEVCVWCETLTKTPSMTNYIFTNVIKTL